jgi:TonB family protein
MTIVKKPGSWLAGYLLCVAFATASGQQRIVSLDMPTYPPLARQARVQGVVTLAVAVNNDGVVSSARLIDGHALLGVAAIRDVRTWRFLSGQPFEGKIIFDFKLMENSDRISSQKFVFDSYRRVEIIDDPPPPPDDEGLILQR